jgi:hypothetical protein
MVDMVDIFRDVRVQQKSFKMQFQFFSTTSQFGRMNVTSSIAQKITMPRP